MLSKLRLHVRHNVVGYLALFFALTGVAYAAGPLKPGDPAGGDLNGSFPSPSIAANAVNSGKVSDDSLTGDDISEATLSGVSPSGAAGGDLTGSYPNPSLASGIVGTANFSGTIPAVRVTNREFASIDVPSVNITTLTWDTEVYDTAGLHSTSTDTSRLTAPVTGVYRITASVFWARNEDGVRIVRLSSPSQGTVAVAQTGGAVGDSGPTMTLVTEAKLTAGEYVEVTGFQNSGVSLRALPQVFTMSWVAPG